MFIFEWNKELKNGEKKTIFTLCLVIFWTRHRFSISIPLVIPTYCLQCTLYTITLPYQLQFGCCLVDFNIIFCNYLFKIVIKTDDRLLMYFGIIPCSWQTCIKNAYYNIRYIYIRLTLAKPTWCNYTFTWFGSLFDFITIFKYFASWTI